MNDCRQNWQHIIYFTHDITPRSCPDTNAHFSIIEIQGCTLYREFESRNWRSTATVLILERYSVFRVDAKLAVAASRYRCCTEHLI